MLLGATRDQLLVLDTSNEPWALERFDAGGIDALHDVSWVGCGVRMAARGTRRVGVWERDGTLVGQAPLPNLVRLLGPRLLPEIEASEETYGSAPSVEELVEVGPLVRSSAGALAMDPVIGSMDEEDSLCPGPRSELRVSLAVPGVTPAPCASAASVYVPLTAGGDHPEGWRCASLSVLGEHGAPAWLGRTADELAAAIPFEESDCVDDPPVQPWERLRSCHPELDGEGGAVGVCRYREDPRLFVGLWPADAMGCVGGATGYVLRGRRAVALAGGDAELHVFGDVWVFGGRASYWVGRPGRDPLRFGRAQPDVVDRGVSPAP